MDYLLQFSLLMHNWKYTGANYRLVTASKLGSFQYRIFHRKTGTKVWLMATGIKDRDERLLRSREHIPKQEIENN